MDELRKERKNKGLCVQCGIVLDRIGIYCIRCNDSNNKSKGILVHKLHEEGKCTTCGQILDREGYLCKKCIGKLDTHSNERNAYRRDKRLCVQCGKPSDSYSYCQRCRDMRMDRYRRNKIS